MIMKTFMLALCFLNLNYFVNGRFIYFFDNPVVSEKAVRISTDNGNFLGSDSSGKVYAVNDGSNQVWSIITYKDNTMEIQNSATKLYLSSDSNGQVKTEPKSSQSSQKWTLSKNSILVNSFTGQILSAKSSGEVSTNSIDIKNYLFTFN